jgi:hypothetical protein
MVITTRQCKPQCLVFRPRVLWSDDQQEPSMYVIYQKMFLYHVRVYFNNYYSLIILFIQFMHVY